MRGLLASLVLAAVLAAAPAAAERLVTSVSNHRVLVKSNFVGEVLVLFGAIEPDAGTPPRIFGYDIVATVVGPRGTVVARRKERRLGIWVNVEGREFANAPLFLAVLSNRPLEQIADASLRQRQRLGLRHVLMPERDQALPAVGEDEFREALVRINARHQLYHENPTAVTLLSPTLFRANIPVPAWAPIGTYEIDIKLFSDGVLLAQTSSAFEVVKVGFEQFVADAAHHYPLIYGLATALMALLTGWLASVVLRRD